MRKILLFATLLAGVLLVGSCGKPKLKNMRALVTDVYIDQDTLKTITVQYDGGDTKLFSMKEARLNNGMVMPQDSVIVDYIEGRHDTARALVVTLLPKIGPIVNPAEQSGNKLQTVSKDTMEKVREKTEGKKK